MGEGREGRGSKAVAGHADMTHPRALYWQQEGTGQGWVKETVGVHGVVGWGCLALTSCF